MLTAIKGTYENGQITLAEKPISNQKMNVIVTFLEEETGEKNPNKSRDLVVKYGCQKISMNH